jgi:alpha-tubulin suppressor-like RCC1 family protein
MINIRVLLVTALWLTAAFAPVIHAAVPLTGATSVAAGAFHTCALTTGGGVKCWGLNSFGQLGNGTTEARTAAVDVGGLTSGVVAIAAGHSHTCALTDAGGVKCWGYNAFGQLGNGTTLGALAPVDVTGLTGGVTKIAAGVGHTCALTTGGGVKCWGGNWYGQLGNGTTTQTSTAVDVTGLTAGMASIAAGWGHTCALTNGGGAKCWGYNTRGQLGNGTTTQALTAVDVSGLTEGMGAIAAAGDHTCALTIGGGVKCWGDNTHGQLGNGMSSHLPTPAPVDVTGLTSGVAAIAAGLVHTCALTTGGGMKCWGGGWRGQLGSGSTDGALTPVVVTGLNGGVAAIAAGDVHTCAVTTGGGVKCWGDDASGQLGNGITPQPLTAVDVRGLTAGVAAIDTGWAHTCAITTGGGAKCWGRNADGTLALTAVDVIGLTAGVAAIAAGGAHACALTTGGDAKCWGDNTEGQLGNGTTSEFPTSVPEDVTGMTAGVAAIVAGGFHTCALTSGGGVKCWGYNASGQLGNGTAARALVPIDVTGLTTGVAAISLGREHTCARTVGGGAKCWGYNHQGQLGDATTTDRLTAVDVVGLTAGVAAIAAGDHHTCALTAGGGVKCWGPNAVGQLGNGSTTQALTAVDVTGLTAGVVAIAAGTSHTCALTSGGGVKCWGHNASGQLGNGATANALVPIDVTGLTASVISIAAGGDNTCALTVGGGAKCWGDNYFGQIGNGLSAVFPVPQIAIVAACTDFVDVDSGDAFCPNVEWLRNRAVTLGCEIGVYCPTHLVNRLQMAAFLSRLGTALTQVVVRNAQVSGALDPDAKPIVCATSAIASTGYPRRAHLDAIVSATGSVNLDLAVDFVMSTDGGVTWQKAALHATRGDVSANRWRNLRALGHADVPMGQALRFALMVSRAGVPGAAIISDSSCNLRVRTDN